MKDNSIDNHFKQLAKGYRRRNWMERRAKRRLKRKPSLKNYGLDDEE